VPDGQVCDRGLASGSSMARTRTPAHMHRDDDGGRSGRQRRRLGPAMRKNGEKRFRTIGRAAGWRPARGANRPSASARGIVPSS